MIILCIDDSYDRYEKFVQMAAERGLVAVVGYGPAFIDFYLNNCRDSIVGICLDHDMPGYDGQLVARDHLRELSIPVVVTSSNPGGATAIKSILDEYAVPCVMMKPVNMLEWQRRALDWFAELT